MSNGARVGDTGVPGRRSRCNQSDLDPAEKPEKCACLPLSKRALDSHLISRSQNTLASYSPLEIRNSWFQIRWRMTLPGIPEAIQRHALRVSFQPYPGYPVTSATLPRGVSAQLGQKMFLRSN